MLQQNDELGTPDKVGVLLAKGRIRLAQTLALDKSVSRLEARVLAAHAWRVTPSWLIAHDTDPLTSLQCAQFHALLERRLKGEPIAYITERREFFGRSFNVTPAVLIPRPETELLVEVMLAQIPMDQKVDILELGTGSGCIAISLALGRTHARITAVDQDHAALSLAKGNALELGAHVKFSQSDWFSALTTQRFDYIVSNPPYVSQDDPHLYQGDVRFEPLDALHAGPHGMDDLQHIIERAPLFLKSRGGLYLEHGYNQAKNTTALLKKNQFIRIRTWQDLSGQDRVTAGFLSE